MNDDAWKHLLDIAIHLIDQVNQQFPVSEHWTLGGGTAMMIQIGHRESRDIDIFICDAQILSYLDPGRQVFTFDKPPSGYLGDGSRFQRIVFDGIGEIDFIACPALTAQPAIETQIGDHVILLETLPEIVAKKVFEAGRSSLATSSISQRLPDRKELSLSLRYPAIAPKYRERSPRSNAAIANMSTSS